MLIVKFYGNATCRATRLTRTGNFDGHSTATVLDYHHVCALLAASFAERNCNFQVLIKEFKIYMLLISTLVVALVVEAI